MNWLFSRPRPLRERIRTISCHGRQLGNASRQYIAVARRRGEFTARRMLPTGPNLRAGSRLSFRPERSFGARGGCTVRRQTLGIGIPSARVAGAAEWRDFHTRTKGRGPHRRPRNKRRRAHCSPSFVVRFTTRMTLGTCTATSRCPSAFFPAEDCTRQQVCTHANRVDRQSAREGPRAH